VEGILKNVCPNCGGGFYVRPVRPRANLKGDHFLGRFPASTTRRHRPVDVAAHELFAADISTVPPEER
jgi:hypothetical protein